MRRFIGNSLYFVIPFVVYSLIIAFIDPFNYLNGFSITSEEKRKTIAQDIEPHLYKIIAFENDPKKIGSLEIPEAMDFTTPWIKINGPI
ncbi:hypothetical protein [Cyclobacterium qasimii]|uniref:Uncharacterized protein n=1 Tax=Cyclobacterium qasimii M12-11B TaxID=641524 RepID=S7V7N1_9BACT|nr:hypothetical protein [Cyclobacterium qasimii]EPR66205.1 hypothetical protein ADICYQ_4903 [Cyclobacterium qasimii M12-11B]